MKRLFARLACLLPLALAGCGGENDDDDSQPVLLHTFTDSTQVFPESVAVVPDGSFYVGSVKEGTLYRGQLGSAAMEVWSAAGADGRTIANGLSWSNDRLVVLGRQSGQVHVYDTRTRALLARLGNGLPPDRTFLNDVVLLPNGDAYITDSTNPALYRLHPAAGGGWQLDVFVTFDGTAVQYVQGTGAAGINVNGIVASGDGRYLVVAKRNENALFRIDIASRAVQRIALPPGAIDTPDGLFLRGRALYVAQNVPRSVAVLALAPDFLSAAPAATVADPSFAFPTAVARLGGRLLVVNAQFDRLGSPAAVSGTDPPTLPFTVTELDAPR